MRVMILAAGRGERLRPLTDTCPKPLIKVGGKPLLEHHIEKLKAAGLKDFVINSAWLSQLIVDWAGDGSRFGVKITHKVEGPGGLETAGGIINALPYLQHGDGSASSPVCEVFATVNADTLMDGDYSQLVQAVPAFMADDSAQALLFMVPKPAYAAHGDFALNTKGKVITGAEYTFSGAALYKIRAFAGMPVQRLPLRPLFDRWLEQGALAGKLLQGAWFDTGTPERLAAAERYWQQHHNA